MQILSPAPVAASSTSPATNMTATDITNIESTATTTTSNSNDDFSSSVHGCSVGTSTITDWYGRKRNAAEYAAAAAEARRKRRKALVQRSHSPRNTRPIKKLTSDTIETNDVHVIYPTLAGVQEVARRIEQGQALSIPTECTYEVVIRISTSKDTDIRSSEQSRIRRWIGTDSATIPHIYVPSFALASSYFQSRYLLEQFPKRPYALSRREGDAVTVHRWNESMHLLRKLAARLWPGPVVLHVAVSEPQPWTIHRGGVNYLTLRCPCHPLAVRVGQECRRRLSTSDKEEKGEVLLLGIPLVAPATSSSSSTTNEDAAHSYMTTAEHVVKAKQADAVLNGEDRREIFAVPTCEHGQPWPVSIWIDGPNRVITIRTVNSKLNSACSSSSASCATSAPSQQLEFLPISLTAAGIKQALFKMPAAKTPKERVILSVLSKWKVVEDSSAH